jgi:hypothetical protein
MEEDKKFEDLDELYKETPLTEEKEKPSKKSAPSSTITLPKRKTEIAKAYAAVKKLKKDDDDELKTAEELKKEEQDKKELILKIEAACQPDLLGGNDQVLALRKELKLTQMSLKDLQAAWSKIMTINGSDHPRHFIYQAAIGIAKRAEIFLENYPTFQAPGFSNRLAQNSTFRTKLHMWSLDKFAHSELSNEMSLVYNIFNEYQSARDTAQRRQLQQEVWGNQTVSQEIVDKFADL